ncbi:hypothetical protein BDW59DRAFT_83659 [Aspergillus cavernicola]|uniref:DUF7730 domain-containing protein n=1 Tax=Aspergillus cavernicola TaxID=176166 RepID=A0ABR4IA11_9EURO
MDLPPEIRNQIYSHLFPPQRVQVVRQKDTQNQFYRLYHIQLAPRDPNTQHQTCLPYSKQSSTQVQNGRAMTKTKNKNENPSSSKSLRPNTKAGPRRVREPLQTTTKKKKAWQTQLALPFTSKQFFIDTLYTLYASTQFVFTSPKSLARFLDTVPKQVQAVINHVELKHNMYNEPRMQLFREIKFRSDRNWFMLCERVANSFKELNAVHVDLRVFDAPIELSVGEAWSLPVLILGRERKKKDGKGLRFARVRLSCNRFEDDEVRSVERELERELMDPVAMQVREDEMMARELAGTVKALRVLRVVFQ